LHKRHQQREQEERHQQREQEERHQQREQEERHQQREQEERHQLQKREQEEIHQQREEMHLLREEMHLLKEEMHLLKRVTGMSQNRRERPGGLESLKTQQLRWGRTTRSSVITVRMPFGRLPETDTRSSRRRTRRPWKPSQRSRMRRNSPHIML
jgi:hypothetical protein